jgi:predicted transcriptional regulator of viral defense system
VDKNLYIYYNLYMKKSKSDIRSQKYDRISAVFHEKTRYVKTGELLQGRIHQRDIKALIEEGVLIKIKNGLYRNVEAPLISNQGFVDAALSIRDGVICLLSALAFYELTTFNPTFISVAVPRGTWKPKIEYPPVEVYYFSGEQFEAGIEQVSIENFNIRIYSPEKTICDCFRYRNKLGLDIAREGLMEYLKKKNRSLEKLLHYAEICRVKSLIQTWLNALI